MGEPALVADCVRAMRDVVDIPVTVKTRIGIDEQDSYEFCRPSSSRWGRRLRYLHRPARKAWLAA